MSVISASDAVKIYESGDKTLRALDGVSVSVDSGEFAAVVGPSGSGKSTLLNLLGLLDDPSEGSVTVDGTSLSTLSKRERTDLRRETVGFIFQSFYLVPTLTARENVAVPGLVRDDRETLLDRADELLTRVGLGDRLDHYPNELSGGQKQRVAIARSMINGPDILLADEPTGNLDQDTGAQVLDVFDAFTEEGVAILTVTHDEQVTAFAERTIRLVDGEIRNDR
ncbi:ABC transporter ATP-binding protein [Halobacteriales archaeon QS_4_62_28]|nr:MAG: ABC transporter ATP-binding protein [Halobacteriales archaeon QS_4_62_28]